MRSLRLALLLTMSLTAAAAVAQPQVDRVEGAAQPGQTFRIFGAGFGNKAHPGPLRWDDFQNGTLGDRLTDHADGGVFDLQAAIDRRPTYSDARQRFPGDVCALQDYSERNNKGMAVITEYHQMYATFWAYRDDYAGTAMRVTNCKLFGNFYDWWTGLPESRWDEYWDQNAGHMQMNDCNANNVSNEWIGAHPRLNQWIRVERYFNYGDPGVANGYAYGAINGVKQGEISGVFQTNACAGNMLGGFVMGNYFRTEDGSGALLRQYISEMYADTTQARVEVGDSADWNTCSKREIQIPTAWQDGVVAIRFNEGSFQAGDQAYAFVVDRDGIPSPGIGFVVGTDYGTGGNIAPVAVNDGAQTDTGIPVVIDVLANDSDADGSLDTQSLTVTVAPAHGSAVVSGGRITYTPTAGYTGGDTFRYTVRDDVGSVSNAALVTVAVGSEVGPPGEPGQPIHTQ